MRKIRLPKNLTWRVCLDFLGIVAINCLIIAIGFPLIYPQSTIWMLLIDAAVIFLLFLTKLPKEERELLQPRSLIPLIPAATVSYFMGLPLYITAFCCVLQFFALPAFIKEFKKQHQQFSLHLTVKLFFAALASIIFIHWLAIIWILLSAPPTSPPNSPYIAAIYWTVTTLATVGYGDIVPTNDIGKIFSMGVMIVGVGVYGLVIGRLSVLIVDSDKRRKVVADQLDGLASLCKHYGLPIELQNEAMAFYRYFLGKNLNEEEQRILNSLPKGLQEQIKVHMTLKSFETINLFNQCEKNCLLAAVHALKSASYGPGEQIIKKGDIGNEMYIISHGVIKVHHGSQTITDLREGASFGEMALIFEEERGADVSALTYCDLLVLGKTDFINLCEKFPDLRRNARAITQKRSKNKTTKAS